MAPGRMVEPQAVDHDDVHVRRFGGHCRAREEGHQHQGTPPHPPYVDRPTRARYKHAVPPLSFEIVRGSTPLLLVAPHGGRRDPDRRPWTSGGLKTNDIHTADLTRRLAARSDASALINDHLDRNDVDLNRISAAHRDAPAFLEALATLLADMLARHGQATVLTIHGWNAIAPALDLGLGCKPGDEGDGPKRRPAVSDTYLRTALPTLIDTIAKAGISVTPGLRYPARGRENLLQLFTGRHIDDERPLVRTLAALGERSDAIQLELAVPLRWPGAWRTRFESAFAASLHALLDPQAQSAMPSPLLTNTPPVARVAPRTLDFVSEDLSGMLSLDTQGGRLLLFEPSGRLVMFTRERLPSDPTNQVAGFRLCAGADGRLDARFGGPMCAFPNTEPFLDLEDGLARADVVDVKVALTFEPDHAGDTPCPFGRLRGQVTIDGHAHVVDASASVGGETWARAGLRLRIDHETALLASPGSTSDAVGFACLGGRHEPLASCDTHPRDDATGVATFRVVAITRSGVRLDATTDTMHELPVVRGHTQPVARIVFAACRLAAGQPAGWCRVLG